MMIRAWKADPATSFKPMGKNTFLVEFDNEKDLETALLRGPWTFRGDLVAIKKVNSNISLNPDALTTSELWVQLYNAPLNLTNEGLELLAKEVGKPVTWPMEGQVGGRRCLKVKVIVDLGEPLKDRVRITHPSVGEITVHCVYEKITRVCTFCARLGHEIQTCSEYLRLSRIAQHRAHEAQIPMAQLLSPKTGLWLLNSAQVPNGAAASGSSCSKRAFSQTAQFEEPISPKGRALNSHNISTQQL